MKTSQSTGRWQGIAGVAALFLGLVALNVLVAGFRWRADLTDEKLYTLSAGTRSLLRSLPRPVQFKLYATRGETMPIPLRQYADRVHDLLREYARLSGGRVTVEVYDPRPDSDEEEWARKYGIEGRALTAADGGPAIFLGLAAVSGTREASLPFLSPEAEPRLEYEITRMLHEVTRSARPRIGLLNSLNVLGAPASPFAPGRGAEPWAFARELQALYDVVSVDPGAEVLPENLTALVVIHPQELSDRLLYAIDQYVLGGGHLLAFVDPMCVADLERQDPRMMQFGFMGAKSDLNRLTQSWGFVLNPMLVCDPVAATMVRAGGGPPQRNTAWLSLGEDALDRSEIASSGLNDLMIPFAGAFAGSAAPGLTLTPLVQASPAAGLADVMSAMGGSDLSLAPAPDPTARLIALRLSGRFPTAFPDGKPGATDAGGTPSASDEESGTPDSASKKTTDTAADTAKKDDVPSAAAESAPRHLKEGVANGVVVLVGDVDLIYDRFAIERGNFFGYEVAQLANDNLNFAWNLVEQLAGSEELIGLRSRGRFSRPFHRVQEIDRRAQAQWRAEEERLMAQLQQTRQRLAELRRTADPSQQTILTEEQRREIERFRNEQFQTERQLKEVRKQRTREIERLGWSVKIANLATMPALVGVFGIVRLAVRRRRASR